MSLLGNLVTQVAQSAMSGNQQSSQSQGGMGDLLGSVLGSALGGQRGQPSGGGMGDILGSVLSSQMNGNSAGGSGLGSVLGSVLSNSMGGGQSGSCNSNGNSNGNAGMLMAMIMPMVLKWIQSKGGLGGALSQIQSLGLTDQANSWMSVDQQNVKLDESQVNELFGADEISQVASQAGVEQSVVAQSIGELLPEVMNQLTPQGDTENEGEANQEISDILSKLGGLM